MDDLLSQGAAGRVVHQHVGFKIGKVAHDLSKHVPRRRTCAAVSTGVWQQRLTTGTVACSCNFCNWSTFMANLATLRCNTVV